jgi:hypothetical protein
MLLYEKFCECNLSIDPTFCHFNSSIYFIRSSVFKTIFNQEDFIEGLSGRVTITNLTPESLEKLLKFIYTDQVKPRNRQSFSGRNKMPKLFNFSLIYFNLDHI